MSIKATTFRANLYRLLEEVTDKGATLTVELNGKEVEIRPKVLPGGKLSRLVGRPDVLKDADDALLPVFDGAAFDAKWDERLGGTAKKKQSTPKKRAPRAKP